MKKTKRLAALMLAVVMVFALCGTALATTGDDYTPYNVPVTKSIYFFNAQGASVYEPNMFYTFTVRGATAAEINGATVKDAAGVSASIKPGVDAAFGADESDRTVGINFSATHDIVANVGSGIGDSKGQIVTKKVNFTFDADALESAAGTLQAGVYRYIITENTTADNVKAKGIVRGSSYDNTLILDVFVTNETTDNVSVMIHDPSDDVDDSIDNSINNTTNPWSDEDKDAYNDPNTADNDKKAIENKYNNSGKTTGFGDGNDPTSNETTPDNDAGTTDPGSPNTDPNTGYDSTSNDTPNPGLPQKTGTQEVSYTDATEMNAALANVDSYTTYNFAVKKTTSGTMADATNEFPFSMAIANSINYASYSVFDSDVDKTATLDYSATGVKTAINDSASGTLTDNLKNADEFWVKGLPSIIDNTANLTVAVTEANNTFDTYTVSATEDSTVTNLLKGSDAAAASVTLNNTEQASTAALTINDGAVNMIEFTNHLDAVSPTGIALRYAPYIFMLAAAAVFVVLSRKERGTENA